MSMHFIELVSSNKYWIKNSDQTSVFKKKLKCSSSQSRQSSHTEEINLSCGPQNAQPKETPTA